MHVLCLNAIGLCLICSSPGFRHSGKICPVVSTRVAKTGQIKIAERWVLPIFAAWWQKLNGDKNLQTLAKKVIDASFANITHGWWISTSEIHQVTYSEVDQKLNIIPQFDYFQFARLNINRKERSLKCMCFVMKNTQVLQPFTGQDRSADNYWLFLPKVLDIRNCIILF